MGGGAIGLPDQQDVASQPFEDPVDGLEGAHQRDGHPGLVGDEFVEHLAQPGAVPVDRAVADQVGHAPVGPDGSWQVEIADLSSGILRLDEVDAAGQVVARVETAFERPAGATAAMTPATAEEQPAPQVAKGVTRVTVERGSTLWAIAREKYGDGVMYVRVFEANRDLIRDPDLIYPGQVFTLPE